MRRKPRHSVRTSANLSHTLPTSKVDPDLIGGFLKYGWQLANEGRDQEAMEIAERTIRMQETDATKAFFVHCVRQWSYFPGAERLRDVLTHALLESWGQLSDLVGMVRELFHRDAVMGPAIRRASDAWPHRLPVADIFGTRGLAAISNDPLLLAILEVGRICDVDFERTLTSIRAGLLDLTMHGAGDPDQEIVRLCCALARQCFINEYIFDLTAEERMRVIQLRDQVSNAIDEGADIAPLTLAMLAAYQGLDGLHESSLLLQRSWPRSVAGLLDQQIRERAAERRHRKSIPKITPITNATSLDVQKQYEENPYPRWVRLPIVTPSLTVDESFQRQFPFSAYRTVGKTSGLDILIAGCGTGRHSIQFAQSFPKATILAVDLSLASLGYAKLKSLEMGLGTIEYAQADILELGQLAREFDIISSAGVLHHLADPMRGWRALLSLLRPNGCMHVGLYSEAARQDVVATQAWLHERGYSNTDEDIRRARQVMTTPGPDMPQIGNVAKFLDFYEMSECRDLLFPSMESRFTIPQIQTFLDENELQFLGFIIGDDIQNQFLRRFSPEQQGDLNLWHQFERENPNTFRAMYEFWVQKRVAQH